MENEHTSDRLAVIAEYAVGIMAEAVRDLAPEQQAAYIIGLLAALRQRWEGEEPAYLALLYAVESGIKQYRALGKWPGRGKNA